jgi:hypothetical protein
MSKEKEKKREKHTRHTKEKLGRKGIHACEKYVKKNQKSHFSAAPALTRPRAPQKQKQKAATTRSPPPLL